MNIRKFEAKFDKSAKNWQVYAVLRDHQWHCRECEYQHTGITQIAGGSGIQGLQRGTKARPGMKIDSDNHFCLTCERKTRHDRWEGAFQSSVHAGSMPRSFVKRAINLLGSRDVVENTERPPGQLTLDHKLPMLRWNQQSKAEQTSYGDMDDAAIRAKFQLLKKSNGSVSHNLLKSRSCERCYQTGRSGTPFGIVFFYSGGPRWTAKSKADAAGCQGCGWFDFGKWRSYLNRAVREYMT